ncbi:MAG: helix-turn-helix transcriptional regulator [Pseudomonadota bacterium]
MSQVHTLVATLKQELKARGLTYADVAQGLALSESSVKRQFAESRFTLSRLEQVCELIGLDISDLVQKMEAGRKRISTLTEAQEKEIAGDPKMLLAAICVLNGWLFDEIIATYSVSEHEGIQLMARLDRLGVIELLPLNRYRLIVASDFRWLPGGPIQQFFQREVQPDFLKSRFQGAGEKLLFRNGMLSRGANAEMARRMERLIADFNELHVEDAALPLEERFGTSLLVAMRPWEFGFFNELRREPGEKRF